MDGDANDLQKYADDLAAGIADSLNGQASTGTQKMQAGSQPQQDALAIAQNGGLSGQEVDDGELDGDGDVDMDDDMMDKISSSPSIEDGGSIFTLPRGGPSRVEFPFPLAPSSDPDGSPVVTDAKSHQPARLSPPDRQSGVSPGLSPPRRHHHDHQLHGESEAQGEGEGSPAASIVVIVDESRGASVSGTGSEQESIVERAANEQDAADGNTTDSLETGKGSGPERRKGVRKPHDDGSDGGPTPPCKPDDDDNDDDDDSSSDGDFANVDDPRFLDSGWGGECLQDAEDIDFEFVYALHTFVATVEGQANATKGDTMVLLDDSNSYWWLVRVVKDSSIGTCGAQRLCQAGETCLPAAQDTCQRSISRRQPKG